MNTAEFEAILSATVIPSCMSLEEQNAVLAPLSAFLSSITPKALYRYRSCNERNLDAFYKDQCWVSKARNMNDGFDSRLFYDKRDISDWNKKILNDSEHVANLLASGENLNFQTDNSQLLSQVVAAANSLPNDKLKEVTNILRNFIAADVSSVETILPTIVQNATKFCCLSEVINSASMWGLYADNESGFALSYDYSRGAPTEADPYGLHRTCMCYPVIYSDTRYKVPTSYIQYTLTYRWMHIALKASGLAQRFPLEANHLLYQLVCPDQFVATKVALYKSNEWNSEREWRVFCSSNIDIDFQNEEYSYFHKKPTALYLGRRISEIYEKILKDIAREKNIPVFKMKLNEDVPTYELFPELIQDVS